MCGRDDATEAVGQSRHCWDWEGKRTCDGGLNEEEAQKGSEDVVDSNGHCDGLGVDGPRLLMFEVETDQTLLPVG